MKNTIDTIAAEAIERRIFPGAVVLIAREDAILHQAAYGNTMYDAPGSRPVALDTIYDIASLTKMFTATAALQLIDAGILGLHAPVAEYLPDFRATEVAVIHLLTHTSGLDLRLSTLCRAGSESVMAAVYAARPARTPGSAVAYTNINSLLLGKIVERICDKSLDQALNELVIGPLELRDTLFRPPAALLPRIAPTEIDTAWRGGLVHGHVHDESAYTLGGAEGHAGLFSTAADLHMFCWMWLNKGRITKTEQRRLNSEPIRPTQHPRQLLREKTIALACTNYTTNAGMACGLGWMLDRPNFMGGAPPGAFGHTGFTGPAIVVVPHYRLIVVVLSNRVYPQRQAPTHHAITAAIVSAACRAV